MTWYTWTAKHWPIIVICAGMIAAAVIDWWKFKVPNKLTFPLVISGWILGLLNNFELVPNGSFNGQGGLGGALMGTLLAMALMIPIYAIGGMGAGDVKMTMGFGSWIGAFYGSEGSWIIVYAFCAGTIVGGIIALGMIAVRRQFKENREHVKEIVSDLIHAKSIVDVADRANNRRSRWHRLPYGVPLCIGFVGYLVYMYATI